MCETSSAPAILHRQHDTLELDALSDRVHGQLGAAEVDGAQADD